MNIIIHEVMKYSAALSVLGCLVMFIPNIYLSIKLRKKRVFITETIIGALPERLKSRLRFAIDANMSWVFAACGLYLWLPYLFFRYGHNVTQAEFKAWHLAIKHAFGKYFFLGVVSAIGGNLLISGAIIFIPLSIYNK